MQLNIGSQFLVRVPGTVSSTAPPPCLTLAPSPSAGFPVALAGGLGLAVLVVLLAVWAFFLRNRARRARRQS
jgi:hypothetical protein